MRKIVDDTCEVICEDNGRKMVGDIIAFKENQYLTVAIEKELKLELKWNRQIYEGRMGRLSFTSEGPIIRNFKQGR